MRKNDLSHQDISELRETFGAIALTDPAMRTIYNFLIDMVDSSRDDRLWEILAWARGRPVRDVGYLASNAVSLLNGLKRDFANRDLSGLPLSRADLSAANLRSAKLIGADLSNAQLSSARLAGADLRKANLSGVFFDQTEGVKGIALEPSGKLMAICSSDGTIMMVKLSDCSVMWEQNYGDGMHGLRFSPDGTTVACTRFGSRVGLWNVKTGELVREFGGGLQILNIDFDPSGELLAGSDWLRGSVIIWDVSSGKKLWELVPSKLRVAYDVCFNNDGSLLLCAQVEGGAALWNPRSGELVREFVGHKSKVESVAFGQGGDLIITAGYDKQVLIWNTASGDLIHRMKTHSTVPEVAVHPSSPMIAVAHHDGVVALWDTERGTFLRQFSAAEVPVFALTFSGDGRYLVTGGQDGLVRLWLNDTDEEVASVRTPMYWNDLDVRGARGLKKEAIGVLRARGARVGGQS